MEFYALGLAMLALAIYASTCKFVEHLEERLEWEKEQWKHDDDVDSE